MTPMTESQLDHLLQSIAAEHLYINTLNTRRSDRLDFHEVSVWDVKSALQAAFAAGLGASGGTPTQSVRRARKANAVHTMNLHA